jgi:signal transduction histidine kinase
VPTELHPLKDQIAHIATDLGAVSQELREISHGLHPAVLSNGLAPALKTLGRRSAVPVDLDIGVHVQVPERVEMAAYYVVAEALTNAAKHAHASKVDVRVHTEDAMLRLLIRDDGDGGADTAKGSGLTGLMDRIQAHGGTMAISSPIGQGTSLVVKIPFEVV